MKCYFMENNSLKLRIGGESMKQSNVTATLAQYIRQNHISVTQVSKDTGIPEPKLSVFDDVVRDEFKLNASEFLTLCAYLNIKPEEVGQENASI